VASQRPSLGSECRTLCYKSDKPRMKFVVAGVGWCYCMIKLRTHIGPAPYSTATCRMATLIVVAQLPLNALKHLCINSTYLY